MPKLPVKSYIADDKQYYVPEIFDCMSTKAAEINGFKVVVLSSSDFSCATTGIPDLKLLTSDEYAFMAERITTMTDMPLFIDADEGFGRPLQTFHGCRRMARAGADGIQVNDLAGNGRLGLLPIDEAVYRFRAAREGMENTNCVLVARCDHSVDDDFDELVERCNRYLEAGADLIMPVKIISSKKYGGKAGAAKKVAEHVKAKFWYPNLNKGEKAADIAALRQYGYKFVGIHYAFRAAMLAMLDAGRHVFESHENDYIDTAYDHTGYKFYYSPVSAFFRGGEWVNRESAYVANPEDAEAVRLEKEYIGPTDAFGPK